MSVKPDAHGGGIVLWVRQLSRKYGLPNPPDNESDAAVLSLITGVNRERPMSIK